MSLKLEEYKELLASLNDNSVLKQKYEELRAYLSRLQKKHDSGNSSFLDLL